MSTFNTMLKKETMEVVRSYKLLIGLAVFAFFGILSPVTAKYLPQILGSFEEIKQMNIQLPEPSYRDAFGQYIQNISQIGTFALIFLAMGAVAKEKDQGTGAFLMVKPVRRSVFIGAKVISLVGLVIVSLLSAAVLCGIYTVIFFENMPAVLFIKINLLLLLNIVTIMTVTVLASTFFTSQAAAGIVSIIIWMVLSGITEIKTIGVYSPGKLIGTANGLIGGVETAWQPFFGSAILIAVCIAASIAVFRKWEP
ncbi:MAG: ABC transporter permease [Spirochaetia bacterium]